MRTVVALYDRVEEAQQTVRALRDAGFDNKDISMIAADQNEEYARQLRRRDADVMDENKAGEGAAAGAGTGAVLGGLGGLLLGLGALAIPGIGPIVAAGPIAAALAGAGIGAAAGGIVGALVGLGIPEEHANYYAEGVRRGGTLVVVQARDEQADHASSIMNQFNPVDIDRRSQDWRQSNWSRFDENAEPMRREEMEVPVTGDRDMTIPVVEEDIDVSKRQVESGGVRVKAWVHEEQVSKDVNLRDEHINVERRPVNRAATDRDKFTEGQVDFKETHEEPVVRKESRVVEEIHIDKDTDQHTETVSDTVRRQQVDVDRITDQEWQAREPRFQQHFQSQYGARGMQYNDYMPAYRYGYTMGMNERYRNQDWNQIENSIRQEWERSGQKSNWNDSRDAIRYGYDEARRR